MIFCTVAISLLSIIVAVVEVNGKEAENPENDFPRGRFVVGVVRLVEEDCVTIPDLETWALMVLFTIGVIILVLTPDACPELGADIEVEGMEVPGVKSAQEGRLDMGCR